MKFEVELWLWGDEVKLPKRKIIRLETYDYSLNGIYFITICTKDKKCILSKIVGMTSGHPYVKLTQYGEIVETGIKNVNIHYPSVVCEKYIIMPNHVHMMIQIQAVEDCRRPMVVPTVSVIINQMKGYILKQIGVSVWQARFYDHVIRNQKSYEEIWQYIDTNPLKWELDRYYVK